MQPENSLAEIETQDLNLGCIPYYYSFSFFLFEIVTTNVLNGLREYVNQIYVIYEAIFTFPLRVFKWTFTFEMWFIPSWTNGFKPHPHTRHLSGLTSGLSNNVACLLTFAWRWTHIAMTLSAEIWRFSYSKLYVMSELIQNIWKTSQIRWKLKIDTWLIL